jgi:small redox-active disulfide protein 2
MGKLEELASCLEPHCELIDTRLVMGNPASSTLKVAEDIEASLVVVGAFSHKGSLESLLGGVAEEVTKQSEVPVLVVKPEPKREGMSGVEDLQEDQTRGEGENKSLLLVSVYSTEICPKCRKLYESVVEVVEEKGIHADVKHVTDAQALADAGIIASPALVVNGKIVSSGWVPSKKEIARFLTRG